MLPKENIDFKVKFTSPNQIVDEFLIYGWFINPNTLELTKLNRGDIPVNLTEQRFANDEEVQYLKEQGFIWS